MNLTKKQKLDKNGVNLTNIDPSGPKLTPEDVCKIVDRIVDKGKLIDIIANAASHRMDILNAVQSLKDLDLS
ncbi:hypothetical protein SO802_015231 [Lithocarpus litseifolius]|uniref:Uncharacterized protein n=1 Tax=Lithocarpus litseifolius TaxID=425828 RepID=A0AAW2CX90_9ROSI